MTYYEIEVEPLSMGYSISEPLKPGFKRGGWVNGKPVFVEVTSSESAVHNGEMRTFEKGAVFFDRRRFFKNRSGLVYLSPYQESVLESYKESTDLIGGGGAFQDLLVGVERLLKEQTGIRKSGQRSLWEKITGILSAGITERISS